LRRLLVILGATACTGAPEQLGYVPEAADTAITPPEQIRIGTFNMEWFAGDYEERNAVDYEMMAQMIEELEPTLLGLQEVKNARALDALYDHGLPSRFVAEVSSDGWDLRPVLLYDSEVLTLSRVLEVEVYEGGFRDVLTAKVGVRGSELELVVGTLHFASEYSDENTVIRAREVLGLQSYIAEELADDYGESAELFAFVGDYNDTFEGIEPEYPTLQPLLDDPSVVFATHNTTDYTQISYRSKIDHLLLSTTMAERWTGRDDLVDGCQVFAHDEHELYGSYEGGASRSPSISDHRPVLIDLDVTL